jgi:hypothetical protein
VFFQRDDAMLDENDIVTAILNSAAAQEALRSIARIAIREVALRSNTALPVEDTTVIGKMTIDRLRRTVTVKGQVRRSTRLVRSIDPSGGAAC